MPAPIDHSRHLDGIRRLSDAATASVAAAAIGAPQADAPTGASRNVSNMIGMMGTGISIITVPSATGVNTRLRRDSRHATANWISDEAAIKLAIIAGPPDAIAAAQTAMNAPDVPIIRLCPAPNRPIFAAWRIVIAPATSSAAKTPQPI